MSSGGFVYPHARIAGKLRITTVDREEKNTHERPEREGKIGSQRRGNKKGKNPAR